MKIIGGKVYVPITYRQVILRLPVHTENPDQQRTRVLHYSNRPTYYI